MKVTQRALDLITLKIMSRLAYELDKSEMSIKRYVSENKDNGPLTTVKAIQVIREETGLNDSEILEESGVVA